MPFKFELTTSRGHILVDLDNDASISSEEIELITKISTNILIGSIVSPKSCDIVEIRPNQQHNTTYDGSREEYYSSPGQIKNLQPNKQSIHTNSSKTVEETINDIEASENSISINALEINKLISDNKNVRLKFVGVCAEEKFTTIKLLKAKTNWGMRMCKDIIENEMLCPAILAKTAIELIEEFKQLDGVFAKIIAIEDNENSEQFPEQPSFELGMHQDS